MIRSEPEHLSSRSQTEAQTRDHRRALQPPSGWCGGYEVAKAVCDRDMSCVAARRFARAGQMGRERTADPRFRRHDGAAPTR